MTPTPAQVAALRPFYVRNATEHADIPGHYADRSEALTARDYLSKWNSGQTFIIKDRRTA